MNFFFIKVGKQDLVAFMSQPYWVQVEVELKLNWCPPSWTPFIFYDLFNSDIWIWFNFELFWFFGALMGHFLGLGWDWRTILGSPMEPLASTSQVDQHNSWTYFHCRLILIFLGTGKLRASHQLPKRMSPTLWLPPAISSSKPAVLFTSLIGLLQLQVFVSD